MAGTREVFFAEKVQHHRQVAAAALSSSISRILVSRHMQ
jgi:hypothetical protein